METKIQKIETTQLEVIVKDSGLQIQEGEEIKASYQPFLIQLSEIQEQAAKINFENPAEIDETIARELRLKTVKVRTGSKDLKDSRKKIYLLRGNLEQAAYNLIEASCKLTEDAFNNVEKAREIAEKKMKENRKLERIEKITPFEVDCNFIDLLNMPDEMFDKLLSDSRIAFENKKEAELKAEQDRLAKEKTEKEEQEMILIENERLKKEAEAKEKELELERKKQAKILADQKAKAHAEAMKVKEIADAKLKAEQEKAAIEKAKADKMAAELKAKTDAEAKEKAEKDRDEKLRIAEERKAAKAPDKEKLKAAMNKILFPILSMDTADGHKLYTTIQDQFSKLQSWAKTEIEKL